LFQFAEREAFDGLRSQESWRVAEMTGNEGCRILFITPDRHPGEYVTAETEWAAKTHLTTKYGNVDIRSCRPMDLKDLRKENITPGESRIWISKNLIPDEANGGGASL
jgi:hypothetical protein